MRINKIILSLLCILLSLSVYGQQQDKVTDVLSKHGKQKGSVLVQLSKDVLSKGSNLSLYKSLIIDNIEQERREEILDELLPHLNRWENLSEVRKQGIIESGTYYISRADDKGNQFLLIKNSKQQLTIIYIKGNFGVDQLQEELKKLKDLFIYINNKRIKIG